MKKSLVLLFTLTSCFPATTIWAQSPASNQAARLAFSNNGCESCHAVSDRTVGPGLQEIAAHYKGQKVSAELAARIRTGSEGRWGSMPHPANEALDPKEAALMARWILAGAPN